ncbi:DNA-cytosine methyltransferase [hydrothermal vent metagenome]|uniref:DNA (cytosine-5-)-methyltransferase n=1 Tax=hydrothermal vent metagenome TaxID=652676 RepID=A0A1W1CJK7_9ZZZZ
MKVISLFSGCGGVDLGFVKAGATILWANDIDCDAVKTYKQNIANHIICKDIYDVAVEEIPNGADLIVGGFPCLGFTVAKGKSRNINDSVNFLYKEYIRVLKAKKTKYFLIENVPGMRSGKEFNSFFENMLKEFEEVGYRVKYQTLLASDYGVPQNRRRIIIIGTRNDIEIEPNFPTPTHSKNENLLLKPYVTIKDAISDLPADYDEIIANHTGSKHKVKINGYVGNRQLDWDKPSPTITGRGSRSGGAVIHPHPNNKRRLSVRECARLQSFPDDFIFSGSNGAGFAHIGNAVPPILSFYLAKEFIKIIDNKEVNFNSEDWDLPWLNQL